MRKSYGASDWAVIGAELPTGKHQNDPPSAIEADGDCRQQRSRQQNVNGTSPDALWLSKETAVPASRVNAQPSVRGEVDPRSEREIIEAALAETKRAGFRTVRSGS